MADSSLKDRLRDHAKAFDGLLSLIPAKMYYGEDTSDQWKKKKQTKDEAKAAKRGKLDPNSDLNKNAKEVMDERARNKRKLRDMQEEADDESSHDEDFSGLDGLDMEKPGEGLKVKPVDDESVPKKQKVEEEDLPEATEEISSKAKVKEEKRAEKKKKKEEKKKLKSEGSAARPAEDVSRSTEKPVEDKGKGQARIREPVKPSTEADSEEEEGKDSDMVPIDVAGLISKDDEEASTAESTSMSTPDSPIFDSNPATKNSSAESSSTTTSISSTVAPSEKPKHIKVPADTTVLRARLAAKIDALRAARKASGMDGQPIRTRQELIESRREKQAQRKAHKKELRRQAKEDEDRKREEAIASARTSPGSILSPLVEFDDDRSANHFAFGRVAFSDGTKMSYDLSYEKKGGADGKKKGPSDPKTALLKLESQKKRVAALDEDKRKEVLEKETWLAARRRAEGVRVHDDESMLKKAVKRKEKAKKKSEREWSERTKGVEKSIKDRQRKREDNIRKRREDKLTKGGKKKGGASKKKNRPGFEGGGFGFGGQKK